MADYYKLLGVSPSASVEEIRAAYRKCAGEFHPDRHPGDAEVAKKFCEISRAYETISDPEKRRAYDAFGKGRSKNLLESLSEDLESALTIFGQVASLFEVPEPKKRSECTICNGTGETTLEIGPIVIRGSCSSCEVESSSSVNGDRP